MFMPGVVANPVAAPVANNVQAIQAPSGHFLQSTNFIGTHTNQFTISFWIRRPATNFSGSLLDMTGPSGNEVLIRGSSSGNKLLILLAGNSFNNLATYDGSDIWTLESGNWVHVLVSCDLSAAGLRHVYVNDQDDGGVWTNYTNGLMNYSPSAMQVGRYNGVIEDLAELYMTNEYLDLSMDANRRKFIDAFGAGAKPVDLGLDGSLPTGTQPLLYLKGDASVWNSGANAGSAGTFSVINSSAIDSPNEPVELP